MTKENPPRINRIFRIIEKRIEKKRTRVRTNKISITIANKIYQFLYSNRDYSNPNKAFETSVCATRSQNITGIHLFKVHSSCSVQSGMIRGMLDHGQIQRANRRYLVGPKIQ